jgi:putative ABC transport system permease protein
LETSLIIPEASERLTEFIKLLSPDNGKDIPLVQGGVVITEKLARKTGINADGNLTVTADGKDFTVRVSGVTENYILNYIYMPPDLYNELFGVEALFNGILINTNYESSIVQNLLNNENVRAVINTTDQKASISDSVDALGIVTIVLIIMACALALVVLFNLTNINITERIRELATIKVLGFYDVELAMYIYRENAVVTLMGILTGLLGGIYLHKFILHF